MKCTNDVSTVSTGATQTEGRQIILINIDYADRRPIYEQIVDKFKELILLGVLKPGDQIPSVRSLATEISINPNTIQRAYGELERDGVINCVKGRGNFVAAISNLQELHKKEIIEDLSNVIAEAKKGNVSYDEFIDLVKGEWDK